MPAEVKIERLLGLYKAGHRPPLDELVNGELLKIFQRGIVKERLSSFGILLPAQDKPEQNKERWLGGNFINRAYSWKEHCVELRKWKDKNDCAIYNGECDVCDREHGFTAAVMKKPLIYLCRAGMVDYAIPILVDDQTVGVLFAGQECPAEGRIWSEDFVKDGTSQDKIGGSTDAWAETQARNQKIMSEMQAQRPNTTVPDLIQLAKRAPLVSPAEVGNIVKEMEETSVELSQLAEKTINYQLNIIKAYFTSRVTRSLPDPDYRFWAGFSNFLSEFAQFYEDDYAFFYMLKRLSDESMQPCTKVPGEFASGKAPIIKRGPFFPLKHIEACDPILLRPSDAKKQLFDSNYLFDSPCYVIPLEVNGPLGIVVMGNFRRKGTLTLIESGRNFIKEQFQQISIILENRRQLIARDMYVTDLAHEVKSPLQSVLSAAENIAAGRIGLDQMPLKAGEMLSYLRRLQMNVDRFRMLDKLLSNPDTLEGKEVRIWEVAKDCEKDYSDLARCKKMRIEIRQSLAPLKVRTDRDAFKHALGNLIHNALKYGDWGTDVIVEGRMAEAEIKIDVRDVGIPVLLEDQKFLGQRGFRSNEARKIDPSGTGIGFTMIDRFLQITGGRFKVESIPHPSGSHHVIISMFLPRYGGAQWQRY